MKNYNGYLLTLPREIRIFLSVFILVLAVGFYTGILFVRDTGSDNPAGIEENYLGNENNEEAEVMKFEKGQREMLTIVHTHILSMSFLFFLLGGLMVFTKLPKKLKYFLIIEPLLSVLLTFGGIYLMWSGWEWMKYVVMISGFLMTACFTISIIILWYQLLFYKYK